MKVEALKMHVTTSRPIKALTVYPPSTPATLVPRVLLIKSQVKVNIFALIQLFSDFEKTYNKRITPTGLTEGERGFEQTKAWKHDELERETTLLLLDDNLIAACLTKGSFYVATNSVLMSITVALSLSRSNPQVVLIVCGSGDQVFKTYDRGSLAALRNFVKKFIETVRFGNDHFGAISWVIGEYVIGESRELQVFCSETMWKDGDTICFAGRICLGVLVYPFILLILDFSAILATSGSAIMHILDTTIQTKLAG
ncbi:hypothetical protein Tco_0566070 [Tanacetum coccineum]